MKANDKRPLHPAIFLILNLPVGIAGGAIAIVLPFLMTRAGLSVGTTAWVVAVGLSPLFLRILWAPVADLTLTYKTWYRIGALLCAGMLLAISLIPIRSTTVGVLAVAAFAMKAGATFTQLPAGGLMALSVPDGLKGRAAAFFHIGSKFGSGLGSAGAVWLAHHTSTPLIGGAMLAAACVACLGSLHFIGEPARPPRAAKLRAQVVSVGMDLWTLVRSSRGAVIVVLVLTPIGVGATMNLFSAIAPRWRVGADMVALVTGLGPMVASTFGSLLAGWWADQANRRTVFLATGAALAVVGTALAAAPPTPTVFLVGTLAYACAVGMCDAAYSALILSVIDGGAAASKYTTLSSIANVPNSYMTALNGRVYDRWGAPAMLGFEALVGGALIAVAAAVLRMFPPTISSSTLPPIKPREPSLLEKH